MTTLSDLPELSESEIAEIHRDAEYYSFQVPYDGTQDFYDSEKLSAFIAGASLYARRAKEVRENSAELLKAAMKVVELPKVAGINYDGPFVKVPIDDWSKLLDVVRRSLPRGEGEVTK